MLSEGRREREVQVESAGFARIDPWRAVLGWANNDNTRVYCHSAICIHGIRNAYRICMIDLHLICKFGFKLPDRIRISNILLEYVCSTCIKDKRIADI